MFTDIVGYTHLSQANESLALELLEEHKGLVRPTFTAHGGTEVKTIGDAFLVEFKSALDAVTCAVELQKKLAERNAATAPSRKLELRIGIHIGDVVHDRGDIYGDAVNIASRIEPLAEPGGVCISQQVFDQIRNKTALEISKAGEFRLRNVDLPQSVYRLNLAVGQSTVGEGPTSRERLGVLPFVNISPDPNDEYFADGLTEELIGKLSEMPGLKVIARTSVMSYKRTNKKVAEIARELDVGSVIEGSVRKAGNRIRVSVQLVDAGTEEHLWSSTYDSQLDDIFAIQTDVASKVASALSTGIFSRAAQKDTYDVEAYTLYLRAIQVSYGTTEASMRETVDLLQRAIAKDPKFARAYAGLANVWHGLAVSGYEDFQIMSKKAESAALKALQLDPGLAEAHSAMSGVHSMLDRFDAALAEAETAVRIKPNLSDAYMGLGVLDAIVRTSQDSLEMFKRAYELDPLSVHAGEMVASLAGWVGDDRLARDAHARMMELHPKDSGVLLRLVDYELERGEFDEAKRTLDAARALDPSNPMLDLSQAILFAATGKKEEAEALLKKLLSKGNETFWLNAKLWVQTVLGNLDEAFDALMRQAETHSWPYSIRIEPIYARLRNDPRYLEFCAKVGIRP